MYTKLQSALAHGLWGEGIGNLTYEESLKMLNLPTLKYHRLQGDVTELYKFSQMKTN